jgi:subfamily B ATP-binding cassette protein MsbA
MALKEPMIILIVVIVVYIQLTLMNGNLGSIILSLILFYRALNFLVFLQQYWANFIQNSGSIQSISKIETTMSKMVEIQGTKEFVTLKKDISVSDVSLTYGKNIVLQKTNIIIPQKQTVALVGESGSGKTSLVNITMGLINPDKGSVFVDGIPLSEYNLDSYRKRIGYISQDPVIFNDSIFNNVTFWAEPTPENIKRFWEVIQMVSLKEFVENKEDKERTNLGDNGLLISGGQKQRISIAREMFKNVEILILDEATSALDSETELMIQENIEKLHGHYTMIVIAHRLSTIKNVDKIYLLDKGHVVVSGNFENMVQSSDKFKRMVALQGL